MLESPRYLLQKGDVKKATRILARVSLWSKCQLPPGQLVTQDEKERITTKADDQINVPVTCNIQTTDQSIQDSSKHLSYGTVRNKDQIDAMMSESNRIISEKTPLIDSSKPSVCVLRNR